ncbi:hypothetical protein [Ramlibacter sp.]|uniref:hypothetical protein n=1 Tax=Ramlibacter sp. TaxID=1917967 RepID=UPI002BD18AF4|nr:hypothetical protein [Ramlibacter sp.]HWI82478.1 hypothetical protein [Ramlibacter sp.]
MHTVLSAFDDREAARRAVERLVQEGFARDDVHLHGSAAADQADDRLSSRALASPEREVAVGPHAMSALDHFFDRLLGRTQHRSHAATYAEAVRRGSSVVVVDTHSEQEAEQAAALLQQLGPCDLAERVEQWRADGWSVDAAGEQRLEGGGVVRWRSVQVLHRQSEPPLRELLRGQRDAPPRD